MGEEEGNSVVVSAVSVLNSSPARVQNEAPLLGFSQTVANHSDDANRIFDADYTPDTQRANAWKEMFLDQGNDAFIEELTTLLDERLHRGQVETIFEVGYEPNGAPMNLTPEEYAKFVLKLRLIGERVSADVTQLRERVVDGGCVGDFLVRKAANIEQLLEVRVAVVGNVDAGKSTMLGVLTRGTLDNGRGKARANMFRHKHELDSGRTSSIAHEIMGFSSTGEVCNYAHVHRISWADVCEASSKVVTFIDLAGHEKYLKTTVFGLTGCAPDFAMLMIGANNGVIGMTKEHLGLTLALNVPVFIVITKIDMCPANVLQDTIKQITKILKSPGCRRIPVFINSVDDVITHVTSFVNERVCPIFQVSNVTGDNLPLMRLFLNLLPAHRSFATDGPVEFQIDDTFLVPGVGTVVSGTLLSGTVRPNDYLLLGPDAFGKFQPVQVKSMHRKRCNVLEVAAGQSACFSLKKVKRSQVRKGMVMLSKEKDPKACMEFEAEILVLYHSTTISHRYQAMVHSGNVRQTAGIVSMRDKDVLRTGDRAVIRFRFLKSPEYIKVGERLLFREGRTKGVGKIVRTIPVGSSEEEVGSHPKHQDHLNNKNNEASSSASATGGSSLEDTLTRFVLDPSDAAPSLAVPTESILTSAPVTSASKASASIAVLS